MCDHCIVFVCLFVCLLTRFCKNYCPDSSHIFTVGEIQVFFVIVLILSSGRDGPWQMCALSKYSLFIHVSQKILCLPDMLGKGDFFR